jgi:type VI secretion system protein VasD
MNINRSLSRRLLPLLGLGLTLTLLVGCGTAVVQPVASKPTAPPPPTRLVLDVNASPRMNPTASGQGAPLMVRIYELAADGRFMDAELLKLLEADTGVLGSDLLGRDQDHFTPGERRQIDKTLNPAARTLGIMATYRVTDGVRWRTTVPIIPSSVNTLQLELGPREITLNPLP